MEIINWLCKVQVLIIYMKTEKKKEKINKPG